MNSTIFEIKRKQHKPQEITSEQGSPDEDMIEYWSTVIPRLTRFSNLIDFFLFTETRVELVAESDEMGNLIEEAVDLNRQINLEVDRDDVHERLNSHNQDK
ncbi:hypothetical protein TNCV_3002361 [Trichonephila clavipes]|nr:hypothetical protein TNCV_3002361 [Trichonephila clavipes]